ncbi:helix-turn-helix transcriptional regulator [Petroclostridium sp. X23]|uniref:helix-turn-helix domain-containing protein n=1 Tax=Petroclostridium sp. X23 TaxID=3045146 RepID=UPI0024ADAE33|nr:helix-turn-helix transcriptional regulator [Petroclostridium sp. X23]WHH58283.1 helix-turn-helix transcriptional regulator [Petroclostridium sp. X23]
MRKYYGDIYKKARIDAGLTQDQAEGMLGVPIRTLSAYENGKLLPHGELVCKMIEVYGAKWLWYMHLKENDPVGKRFLPDVRLGRLSSNVLRLQKEMADVTKINPTVVEVACDDEISEHEKNEWGSVHKEISELMGACAALLVAN